MMKFKRFAALALSFALLVSSALFLLSCGSVKPIESSKEDMAVIGTIAGRDVFYEELRYLTLNHKDAMEAAYGEKIWDDPEKAELYREELEKLVWDGIVSDYYAVIAMADEYYIGGADVMFAESAIGNAVQNSVDSTAEAAGGRKDYISQLADIYMTDRLFRFYLTAENCATELFHILYQDLGIIDDSDEYAQAYMHSNKFIRTNHIYLEGLNEENLNLAETVHTALLSSSDPEADLIIYKGRYCDDWTMTTKHGCYFAALTSDYGDEYEKAAFSLGVGDVSPVITTLSGYYVIMRLPVEEDYLTAHFDEFKDDIIGSEFNVILAEEKSKLTLTLNEYGKSIDILQIK